MTSIVCVFTDKAVLGEWLLASLTLQDAVHELVLIDNSRNAFVSAAAALNYGGSVASGDYLIFVHQDVRLEGAGWLREAEHLLGVVETPGVCGVAGIAPEIRSRKDNQRNCIKHGASAKVWGNRIEGPEQVQTLDELLFIVPRDVFRRFQFDQTTCSGWHLYSVDYCLNVFLHGYKNYVLPLPVWHLSTGGGPDTPLDIILNFGTMTADYYRALRPVLSKHRGSYKNIYTTCGIWNTAHPIWLQRSFKILGQGVRYGLKKIGVRGN